MGEVIEFSEAARLYAENFQVVETMHAGFDAEATEFYDRMRELVAQASLLPIREKITSGYRTWWIGGDDQDHEQQPRLWFDTRKVEVVIPGKWELTAVASEANSGQLGQLAQLAFDSRFESICTPGSGGRWSLFTVSLDTANSNPEMLAEKILNVLQAMRDVNVPEVEAPS